MRAAVKRTRAATALPVEASGVADAATSAAAILAAAQASEGQSVASIAEAAEGLEKPATFDDFASGSFEPLCTRQDLEKLRPTYEQNWTPLALAMLNLTKSSDELAELSGSMERDGEGPLLVEMIESISASSKWYAETAVAMDIASTRLMCGMCRSAKADGLSPEGP